MANPSVVGERCCLFICSSDNTVDVFHQVIAPSMARYWADCPLPRYVGLNSKAAAVSINEGYRPLLSSVSVWGNELAVQLRQLPEQYTHVLLWLDDFLLRSPVQTREVCAYIALALEQSLDCLRMVPVERSILGGLLKSAAGNDGTGIEILEDAEPYYSSLQVALWKRSHLLDLLSETADIWVFEHQRIAGRRCYAVSERQFDYLHMVERGQWQPYAAKSIQQHVGHFQSGTRPQGSSLKYLRFTWGRLKFLVIGYAMFRLRNILRDARKS